MIIDGGGGSTNGPETIRRTKSTAMIGSRHSWPSQRPSTLHAGPMCVLRFALWIESSDILSFEAGARKHPLRSIDRP